MQEGEIEAFVPVPSGHERHVALFARGENLGRGARQEIAVDDRPVAEALTRRGGQDRFGGRGAEFGERDSREAGAFHAGEILYVFDNLDVFPWLIDDADRTLARIASSYWVNFVKTGDPKGSGLPPWPSYRGPGAPVMGLDAEPKAGPEERRDRQAFLSGARSGR